MKSYAYEAENYRSSRPAVGLIVLQTDEVLENEIRHWLPSNIDLFHTRIPSGTDVTEETLGNMKEQIVPATKMFPIAAQPSVIAYCCTSGTTVIGENTVENKIRTVFPDCRVTNPLTAIKSKLKSIGAVNIGLLTPYEPHVSNAMASELKKSGFEIVSFGSFNEKEEAKVTRISKKSILAAMEGIAAESPCDAVFASCTNLRTLDILQEAENRLGLPVISSNSALAWHIGKLLD